MPTLAKKVNLTDRLLKAIKPAAPGTRPVIWDSQVQNFGIRITDKGHRTFVVLRRPHGAANSKWYPLGTYPNMSLADARVAARETLDVLLAGKDPKVEKEAARKAAEAAAKAAVEKERREREGSFANVAERYCREQIPTLRTGTVMQQLIEKKLVPVLGDRPMEQIARPEIKKLVADIRANRKMIDGTRRATSGGVHAARKALSVLSAMFEWAEGEKLCEVNPCIGIRKSLGPQEVRDRTLTDQELKWLWQAADAEGNPNGPLIKLLILTGQRLREIGDMRWSEIDTENRMLNIPRERMKGRNGFARPHTVPLSDTVMALLAEIPGTRGDYVFTMTGGKTPVNGYDRLKVRLDDEIAKLAGNSIPRWVLHDIRRSMRTNLSRVGVAETVAEEVIAHAQRGVLKVYNKWGYLAEKRAALEAWEALLMTIVAQPGDHNVLPLPPKQVAA